VAKKFLLSTLQEAEGLDWTDPWLQSIDLEYHNVSLEDGIFYELVRSGQMRRFVSEDDVRMAIFSPPVSTRAFFRGRAVAKFNREISSIQWDEITFQENGSIQTVTLPHPGFDANLERMNGAIRGAKTFAELQAALGRR
jgi:Pup amidohydrolase